MTRHLTHRTGIRIIGSALVVGTLGFVGLVGVPAADAQPATPAHHSTSLGTTTVTTDDGIATTLLGAGVVPLPVLPNTSFRVILHGGVKVAYGFPITSSTADLATGTGDVLHAGGILFASFRGSLEIGKFDIDLAAGKVFATEVNGKPGRIAVLDLDLSGLHVRTGRGGTALTGITATLDGAAAGALNATFGLHLPTDGSLAFAKAKVFLKG